jgi:hypothetical protein
MIDPKHDLLTKQAEVLGSGSVYHLPAIGLEATQRLD